ncbi:MAG: tyrosine-type recombinase/integrase [Gemmataceae bacterium]
MASLQKKGESYYCQFMYHGKRHTFTVGAVSDEEAENKARQVDYLLMRLKQRLIVLPDGVDIVTFVEHDGKPPSVEGIPITRKSITLGDARDRYLQTVSEGAVEDSSLSTTRMHLRHFVRTVGEGLILEELTQPDLQRHISTRARKKYRGKPLSPVTLKKELASVRAMWNWAVHAGLIRGHFPSRGLVYPKCDEKPPFQTRAEIERKISAGGLSEAEQRELWDALFLTLPEIDELLEYVRHHAAHGWIYPMIAFAAHTGARRSEILRVLVQDVDMVGDAVLIREKKRARGKRTIRRVPLSPKLKRILQAWMAEHPGGQFLFCHAAEVARSKKRSKTTGHQWGKDRSTSLKGRMAAVKKRAKPLLSALSKDEAHDHFQRVLAGSKWEVLRGWHVLRHSFVSNAAAAGIDQRLIDSWVGHQTEEMRRRYRHLIPSVEQEAISRMFK